MRPFIYVFGLVAALLCMLYIFSIGGLLTSTLTTSTSAVYTATSNEYRSTITLTTTAKLTPGTVIAPHLYDWSFDGKDDYVYVELPVGLRLSVNEPYGTIATRFVDYDTDRLVGAHLPHTGVAGTFFAFGVTVYSPTKVQGYFRGLGHYGYVDVGEVEGKWLDVVFGYHVLDANNTQVFMWIDGQGQSLPNNGLYTSENNKFGSDTDAHIMRIGWTGWNEPDEWLEGKVSYVVLWRNKLLGDAEVSDLYSKHIVISSSLELFMDATFYNGTHYIDLASGVVGTPYGGVKRVLAGEKWLWVVVGLRGDEYVHFEWFPAGSEIHVYDSAGGLVLSFTCYGGEVKAWLPPGEYTVKAVIPLPLKLEVTSRGVNVYELTGSQGSATVTYTLNTLKPGDTIKFTETYRPTITLTTTATIQPNTVIAPHLYDWWFDENAYACIPDMSAVDQYTGSSIAFALWAWAQDDNGGTVVNRRANSGGPGWRNYGVYSYYIAMYTNESGTYHCDCYRFEDDAVWDSMHVVGGEYDGSEKRFYVDGELKHSVASAGQFPFATGDTDKRLFIGDFDDGSVLDYRGYFMALAISRNPHDYMKLYDHIITEDTLLLVDPTFYNGTHYLIIDRTGQLTLSVPAEPARLPAHQQWLWIIEGLAGDGLVHFRFVPAGCVVELAGASGSYVFDLSGVEGDAAGLVEDYAVDVPEGEYMVTLTWPGVSGLEVESGGEANLTLVGFPLGSKVTVQAGGYVETVTVDEEEEVIPLDAVLIEPTITVELPVTEPKTLVEAKSYCYLYLSNGTGIALKPGDTITLPSSIAVKARPTLGGRAPLSTRLTDAVAGLAPWVMLGVGLALAAIFMHTRHR